MNKNLIHTRKFWSFFLIFQLVISFLLTFWIFGFNGIMGFIQNFIGVSGAIAIGLIIEPLFDTFEDALSIVIFLIFYFSLSYKIFKPKEGRVNLVHAGLLSLAWVISIFTIVLFVGAL